MLWRKVRFWVIHGRVCVIGGALLRTRAWLPPSELPLDEQCCHFLFISGVWLLLLLFRFLFSCHLTILVALLQLFFLLRQRRATCCTLLRKAPAVSLLDSGGGRIFACTHCGTPQRRWRL